MGLRGPKPLIANVACSNDIQAIHNINQLADHYQKLGMDPFSIDFIASKKDKLLEFIYSCYRNGGFSATSQHFYPSILFTYLALLLLRNFFEEENFFHTHNDEIFNFIRGCKSNGGFSFYPGFLPNAYSTRIAIQILKWIKEFNSTKEILTDEESKEIQNFIINGLYSLKNGGFYGYPPEKTILDVEFTLEGFKCPDVKCSGRFKLEDGTNVFKCPNCGAEVTNLEEWLKKADEFGKESIHRVSKRIFDMISEKKD